MAKDEKFIMMNIDDERSKKVAEAISNPTCKKILNYIAENKEKSEEDIAKDLGMPINTVEYNLKKLLESGLVEKSKNFFWSKRGKKINLYKPANRHIVISPKKRPDMDLLKTIIPVIIAVAFVIAVVVLLVPKSNQSNTELNKFSSLEELNKFLKDNQVQGGYGRGAGTLEAGAVAKAADSAAAPSASQGSSEYSSTNIQVEGVDEADIIKNDGKYIYVVSGNKVVIVDAFPADNMKIISEINLSSENGQIGNIFVNGDKLIVFSNQYSPIIYAKVRCMAIGCIMPQNQDESKTAVYIYDISNREKPVIDQNISLTGNYVDSRMIDNYVYLVANQYAYNEGVLPAYDKNGETQVVKADEVYYSPIRDQSFQFTNILAINVNNGVASEKTVLTGASETIFVSKSSIYTTYLKYAYYWDENSNDTESTIINKFTIDKDKIEFVSSGQVPGHLLNQFSMDENKNYFRIATTISGYVDNKDTSTNNLYVLDESMNVVGKIEGIATGESIYSVRFIGNRAYMVTFKHVDPLFVIGLEDPSNPTLLGKLKIPGYSEYLHPLDETHIMGLGKEVDESIDADKIHTEGAVYYTAIQGVKLAIFDVSDVSNPIEMHKEVIGDRGTQSPAETDHKAFLYDSKRGLLVIPITVAELRTGQSKSEQGDFTFQGAYVYKVSLDNGFELKGRITHYENDSEFKKSGYYFYGGENSISRSLYMDDTLYTFSPAMIKANDINSLDEINSVKLPYTQSYGGPYYAESGVGVARTGAVK
ncbi:beta-propeller domain-containing protein [Candidatus Pacearchaeota archaeon]|nr:beta-propeller domain-containing protein [Candidatus Pacearchaeota archaeon]